MFSHAIKKYTVVIGTLAAVIVPLICGADNADSIPCGTAWYPEGGSRAPVKLEQITVKDEDGEFPAVKMVLSHAKSYNKIFLPVKGVNISEYNTVSCRVRFEMPDDKPGNFSFHLLDSKSNWACTAFAKHGKKLKGDTFLFKWDMVNQPDVITGFNIDNFNRLAVSYNFPGIPEGKNVVIIIYDVRLVKGERAITGDPASFDRWKKYISSYAPDYSDSSKYLSAPETGRLKTPLALFADGKANGEIIVDEQAPEPEKNVAEELQSWLGKIAGGTIPIVAKPAGTDNIKIFIGAKFARPKYDADISKLKGTDGFAVRTNGKNILIFGGTPKGTLNGVFAFIENNSDLIWARPHAEYGTIFSKNPNLKIVWGDALEIPASRYRGWLSNAGGDGEDFPIWTTRNRGNYRGGQPKENIGWGNFAEIGGGHNLQTFIPKGNPDFYPVIKGEKPKELSIWKHQICMNAPDLVKVYAANVADYITKKGPKEGLDAVNIKIEDNWGVCECEKCTAPIKLPDGKTIDVKNPAFRSTQFFDFLNKVTAELNKTWPELKVQTYGYFFTATPPLIKVNPNINVLFCPYPRKDYRTPLCSPMNDHWHRMAKGFAEKTNVVVREYYGIFTFGRPLAEVVAWDVKDYIARGTYGFASEISTDGMRIWWDGAVRGAGDDWDFNMMEFWLISRIYWNPDADVEALRKYYIRRTFREAAPEMEKFFGTIRSEYYKNTLPCGWMEAPSFARFIIDSGHEENMRGLLSQALAKAKNPVSRILIGRIQERFEKIIGEAKSPQKQNAAPDEKGEKNFPARAWEYGWVAEGPQCNVRRTTIEVNGRFVPAQHLIFRSGKETRSKLKCSFAFDSVNFKFKFAVMPSPETVAAGLPLPEFSIADERNSESAPETAYKKESGGQFTLDWKPTGKNDKGKAIDFAKTKWLYFNYPYSKIPEGGTAEFYIYDTEISNMTEGAAPSVEEGLK